MGTGVGTFFVGASVGDGVGAAVGGTGVGANVVMHRFAGVPSY